MEDVSGRSNRLCPGSAAQGGAMGPRFTSLGLQAHGECPVCRRLRPGGEGECGGVWLQEGDILSWPW